MTRGIMDITSEKKIGWYSSKQEDIMKKYVIYTNKEGKEIKCTEIILSGSNSRFKDAINVGPVVKYIRSVPNKSKII